MDDWDDYRLILALARSGTLRGAAGDLRLTHTTVSRRLASLESRRGNLFEKHADGYHPTALGLALIDVAEQIEGLTFKAERFARAVDQSDAGAITLSLPEAIAQYLLLEDLVEFAQSYPQIELRVQPSYRLVDLDRSEADVVVRGAFELPDHLVGRRLYPNCVAYYASRDYLENTPRDRLCWIAPSPETRMPGWLENSPFPDAPIALTIDDITTRHQALVNGLGMGRGACFMADPEPGLVRLDHAPPEPQQDIWVLTHPDLRHTPRIRLLMDHIAKAMAKKKPLVLGEMPQAFAEL